MLKKISLILVLFFAYFCCILNVYADDVYNKYKQEFRGRVVSHYNSVALVNRPYEEPNSGFVTSDYNNDNLFHHVCNYNLFGNYSNGPYNGENICYRGPISNVGGSDKMAFHFLKRNWTTTTEDGNVFFNYQYLSSDYVEIIFPAPYPTNNDITGYRLDFSLHLNMNIIPQDARHQIFGSLYVEPNTNNGVTYCSSMYVESEERIDISCSTSAKNTGLSVKISARIPVVNSISEGNYNYYTFFDVSDYSTTATASNDFNNLDMDGSPTGLSFDDYYDIIHTNSDNYFNNFSLGNFNSLTRVITSPLVFIQSLSSESTNDLNFSIFGKNITLKNGNSLFWNRRFHSIRVGSYYCDDRCANNMFADFKWFWELIFGYFLLYIFTCKFIKVLNKCLKPTNSDLEVF